MFAFVEIKEKENTKMVCNIIFMYCDEICSLKTLINKKSDSTIIFTLVYLIQLILGGSFLYFEILYSNF